MCCLVLVDDELILRDGTDNVLASFRAAEATLRIRPPSFWGSRFILIDVGQRDPLCFEPSAEAVSRVRALIGHVLEQNPVEAATAMRRKGTRDLLIGGGSLGLGLAITAWSFGAAEPGGEFVITVGLIVVGVVEVLRGAYWMVKAGRQ
jgi:hypothetical protein